MSGLSLGKMTLRSAFSKPETVQYPFETKPQPEGLRGSVQIEVSTCILCGICEKKCPTHALNVDKPAKTWSINRFDCVQCASCVRECPKKCLSMDPNYAKPSTNIFVSVFDVPLEDKKEK